MDVDCSSEVLGCHEHAVVPRRASVQNRRSICPEKRRISLPLGEDDEPRSRRVPTSMLEPFGDPDLDDRLTGHPEALGLPVELLDHP